MKTLFLTNEYPPHVYGGAGVHVEYLSRELAKLMDVEVRAFGDQDLTTGRLRARGFPVDTKAYDCPEPLKSVFGAVQRAVSGTPPASTPTSCTATPGIPTSAASWRS